MKTKGKNEEKTLIEALEAHAPALARVAELEEVAVVQWTPRELMGLGRELVKRAPPPVTKAESAALAQVTEACELGDAVVAYNAALADPVQAGPARQEVVMRGSTIKVGLATWAEGKDAGVAAQARQVQQTLFPPAEILTRLDARALWQAVEAKRSVLAAAPALRVQLDELVPPSMTEGLFEAHDALGAAMGVVARVAVKPLDLRRVGARVRQAMVRWLAAVVATADATAPATVERAMRAVVPIAEAQAQDREQRRRRNKKAPPRKEGAGTAPAPTTPEPTTG